MLITFFEYTFNGCGHTLYGDAANAFWLVKLGTGVAGAWLAWQLFAHNFGGRGGPRPPVIDIGRPEDDDRRSANSGGDVRDAAVIADEEP